MLYYMKIYNLSKDTLQVLKHTTNFNSVAAIILSKGIELGVDIIPLVNCKLLDELITVFDIDDANILDIGHYILVDLSDNNVAQMLDYILKHDVYLEDLKRYFLDEFIPTIDKKSFHQRALNDHKKLLDIIYKSGILI